MQVAKTVTNRLIADTHFLSHYVVTIHQCYRRTDRQTDKCHAFSISATRQDEIEWRDAGMVMCLGQGADLHMAQLMSLPLTISCSSKSRLVLPSWFYLSGAG